jgi:putative Mn2+ efflux pump MntP
MSLWTLTLIALGVSADAFAVAVGKGLTMPRLSRRGAVLIAVMFGAFQGTMPLVGWLLGSSLEGSIERVDHWVAFGLLAAVGTKMLHEALLSDDGEQDQVVPVRERVAAGGGPLPAEEGLPVTGRLRESVPAKELTLLSVATSVDALAVGISFAFLEVSIGPAVGPHRARHLRAVPGRRRRRSRRRRPLAAPRGGVRRARPDRHRHEDPARAPLPALTHLVRGSRSRGEDVLVGVSTGRAPAPGARRRAPARCRRAPAHRRQLHGAEGLAEQHPGEDDANRTSVSPTNDATFAPSSRAPAMPVT